MSAFAIGLLVFTAGILIEILFGGITKAILFFKKKKNKEYDYGRELDYLNHSYGGDWFYDKKQNMFVDYFTDRKFSVFRIRNK